MGKKATRARRTFTSEFKQDAVRPMNGGRAPYGRWVDRRRRVATPDADPPVVAAIPCVAECVRAGIRRNDPAPVPSRQATRLRVFRGPRPRSSMLPRGQLQRGEALGRTKLGLRQCQDTLKPKLYSMMPE
jgi:hypothetical protein